MALKWDMMGLNVEVLLVLGCEHCGYEQKVRIPGTLEACEACGETMTLFPRVELHIPGSLAELPCTDPDSVIEVDGGTLPLSSAPACGMYSTAPE